MEIIYDKGKCGKPLNMSCKRREISKGALEPQVEKLNNTLELDKLFGQDI